MIRTDEIRFVLGYVTDNDVPVAVVPACKQLDALEAERDRYREAIKAYRSEVENPVPDRTMIRHRRQQLFALIGE